MIKLDYKYVSIVVILGNTNGSYKYVSIVILGNYRFVMIKLGPNINPKFHPL